MRLIDADRALEIVRDQGIAHPNAHHLTRYATLILQEAPTITDLSKCVAFNSTVDGKSRTNADRIRAMSDEELVVFLDGFSGRCLDCAEDAKNKSCQIYKEGRYCRPRDIMEWLQKPVEGE